jgi:pSer/pThr/pTyr-binding forkhead associated (FHA) protein
MLRHLASPDRTPAAVARAEKKIKRKVSPVGTGVAINAWKDGSSRMETMQRATIMVTMLTLRALTGDLRGQEFTFRGPAYCMMGRSRTCQLRLPGDATVSRQHCLIELEGGGVWVQDLGSLNGTLVNGEKIGQRDREHEGDATMVAPGRHLLEDGDELRVCNNIFAVVLSDAPSVRTPTPQPAARPSDWSMPVVCI